MSPSSWEDMRYVTQSQVQIFDLPFTTFTE
jgi:hypothetical protein